MPRISPKSLFFLLVLLLLPHARAQAPLCGDCDLDGVVTILDALRIAQMSTGQVAPASAQEAAQCVRSGMRSCQRPTIVDALIVAQAASGLPVTLTCPSVAIIFSGPTIAAPVSSLVFEVYAPFGPIDVDFHGFDPVVATWQTEALTPLVGSPLPNPALGLTSGIYSFLWDTRPEIPGTAPQRLTVAAQPRGGGCGWPAAAGGLVNDPMLPAPGELVISEMHLDPMIPSGDADGDGLVTMGDIFFEIVNRSTRTLDLSQVELVFPSGTWHTFAPGTMLASGRAIVVFAAGGTPTGTFGGSQIQVANGTPITSFVPLEVTLEIPTLSFLDAIGTAPPLLGSISFVRVPEPLVGGTFGGMTPHDQQAPGLPFTPGTRIDGVTSTW